MSGRVAIFLTLALAASATRAQAPAPKPAKPTAPTAQPAGPTAPKPGVPKEAPVPPGTEAAVETAKGSFTIRLLPEVAPRHAALFVKTARAGGYDGTTFHRVIAGGIIQGGDPLTKEPAKASLYGTGGLGLLKAELSDRPFVRGTVAAVRRPSSLDSGGVQFFVVMREQPSMKGQYTIFGEVVSGMEVVDQISAVPADGDKAKERVEMKVTVREKAPE
jgi:peptidyl-prolyl cis-trans isomerase B (cyclophilin B)